MAPDVPPKTKSLMTLDALLFWLLDEVDDPPCIIYK